MARLDMEAHIPHTRGAACVQSQGISNPYTLWSRAMTDCCQSSMYTAVAVRYPAPVLTYAYLSVPPALVSSKPSLNRLPGCSKAVYDARRSAQISLEFDSVAETSKIRPIAFTANSSSLWWSLSVSFNAERRTSSSSLFVMLKMPIQLFRVPNYIEFRSTYVVFSNASCALRVSSVTARTTSRVPIFHPIMSALSRSIVVSSGALLRSLGGSGHALTCSIG